MAADVTIRRSGLIETVETVWHSLLVLVQRAASQPSCDQEAEAINVLCDASETDERRDWAERYLSRMERVDFATYGDRRSAR